MLVNQNTVILGDLVVLAPYRYAWTRRLLCGVSSSYKLLTL
jgi:hypothetical protein